MKKLTPQKKVYKGKIYKAFLAITTTPVPAEWIAKQHNVCVGVLRQANRFDKTGGKQVLCRKQNGILVIWRE